MAEILQREWVYFWYYFSIQFDQIFRYWAFGIVIGSMITGPATKITNLGAVKIVLGVRRFALYILFSMAFAFLSGILIDLIL